MNSILEAVFGITINALPVNIEQSDDNDAIILKLTNSGDQLVENVGLSLAISSSNRNPVQIGDDDQLRYDNNSGLYNILTPLTEPHETLIVGIRYD